MSLALVEHSLEEVIYDGISGYITLITSKQAFTLTQSDMKTILIYVSTQYVFDMFLKSWIMPLFNKVFTSKELQTLTNLITEVLTVATEQFVLKKYILKTKPTFMGELMFTLSASSMADKLNRLQFTV